MTLVVQTEKKLNTVQPTWHKNKKNMKYSLTFGIWKKCVSTIKLILYAIIYQRYRVDRPHLTRAVQQTVL